MTSAVAMMAAALLLLGSPGAVRADDAALGALVERAGAGDEAALADLRRRGVSALPAIWRAAVAEATDPAERRRLDRLIDAILPEALLFEDGVGELVRRPFVSRGDRPDLRDQDELAALLATRIARLEDDVDDPIPVVIVALHRVLANGFDLAEGDPRLGRTWIPGRDLHRALRDLTNHGAPPSCRCSPCGSLGGHPSVGDPNLDEASFRRPHLSAWWALWEAHRNDEGRFDADAVRLAGFARLKRTGAWFAGLASGRGAGLPTGWEHRLHLEHPPLSAVAAIADALSPETLPPASIDDVRRYALLLASADAPPYAVATARRALRQVGFREAVQRLLLAAPSLAAAGELADASSREADAARLLRAAIVADSGLFALDEGRLVLRGEALAPGGDARDALLLGLRLSLAIERGELAPLEASPEAALELLDALERSEATSVYPQGHWPSVFLDPRLPLGRARARLAVLAAGFDPVGILEGQPEFGALSIAAYPGAAPAPPGGTRDLSVIAPIEGRWREIARIRVSGYPRGGETIAILEELDADRRVAQGDVAAVRRGPALARPARPGPAPGAARLGPTEEAVVAALAGEVDPVAVGHLHDLAARGPDVLGVVATVLEAHPELRGGVGRLAPVLSAGGVARPDELGRSSDLLARVDQSWREDGPDAALRTLHLCWEALALERLHRRSELAGRFFLRLLDRWLARRAEPARAALRAAITRRHDRPILVGALLAAGLLRDREVVAEVAALAPVFTGSDRRMAPLYRVDLVTDTLVRIGGEEAADALEELTRSPSAFAEARRARLGLGLGDAGGVVPFYDLPLLDDAPDQAWARLVTPGLAGGLGGGLSGGLRRPENVSASQHQPRAAMTHLLHRHLPRRDASLAAPLREVAEMCLDARDATVVADAVALLLPEADGDEAVDGAVRRLAARRPLRPILRRALVGVEGGAAILASLDGDDAAGTFSGLPEAIPAWRAPTLEAPWRPDRLADERDVRVGPPPRAKSWARTTLAMAGTAESLAGMLGTRPPHAPVSADRWSSEIAVLESGFETRFLIRRRSRVVGERVVEGRRRLLLRSSYVLAGRSQRWSNGTWGMRSGRAVTLQEWDVADGQVVEARVSIRHDEWILGDPVRRRDGAVEVTVVPVEAAPR